MSKSSRRVIRTTAAVIGMTALGAIGSGTAFADTAPALDTVPDAAGHTDLAGATDSLGAAQGTSSPELHSFEMPSVGGQHVSKSSLAHRHHFNNHHVRSHHDNHHDNHRGRHHRHH